MHNFEQNSIRLSVQYVHMRKVHTGGAEHHRTERPVTVKKQNNRHNDNNIANRTIDNHCVAYFVRMCDRIECVRFSSGGTRKEIKRDGKVWTTNRKKKPVHLYGTCYCYDSHSGCHKQLLSSFFPLHIAHHQMHIDFNRIEIYVKCIDLAQL